MGFGSAFGLSAISSAAGSLFGNLNSFNRSTYRSGWGNAIDPAGGFIGKLLIDDDTYQDERSLSMSSALAAMQYQYALRGMLEGPSAVKKGLIKAGYNPMLAIGSAMSPASVSVAHQSPQDSPRSSASAIDIASAVSSLASARQAREMTEVAKQSANVKNDSIKASTAAEVALKIAEAERIRKETESFNPTVEKENRKYGNGLVGEVMRFGRTFKEGLGFTGSSVDSRLGDYFRSLIDYLRSASSAREVKVISDKAHRDEKKRGDAARKRRMRH